jgi:phosphatidate cytidylyltransferase
VSTGRLREALTLVFTSAIFTISLEMMGFGEGFSSLGMLAKRQRLFFKGRVHGDIRAAGSFEPDARARAKIDPRQRLLVLLRELSTTWYDTLHRLSAAESHRQSLAESRPMNPRALDRLFGYQHSFDHPISLYATIGVVALLLIVPLAIELLVRLRRIESTLRRELYRRYLSWLIITPLLLAPILLGAGWMMIGIGVLSVLCYREYARATGLFRFKAISATVVAGIVLITLAVLDHWYRLFVALTPLTICAIASVGILADEPKGYIQRVALGIVGFLLFGTCLGHLAYFGNDENYRPLVILVILAVEMNDVFAFIVGKTIGGPKLCPNTSPNNTVSGAVGAPFLTTLLVLGIGMHLVPAEQLALHGITSPHELRLLIVFGVIISVVGQLGELMLSSIKRDLGLKDMGGLIPGHGGLLDRFDSLILVAPAAFHYANYVAGIGLHEPIKIFR